MRHDHAEIAAKARELIKTPFAPYGRSKTRIDCIGVPMWVAWELGIWPRFKLRAYAFIPHPQPEFFDEYFPQYADEVAADEMAEGDIVIFVNYKRLPQHVGILVNSRRGGLGVVGVTLSPSRKRVDEFPLDDHLRSIIYKVWRYRDVQA